MLTEPLRTRTAAGFTFQAHFGSFFINLLQVLAETLLERVFLATRRPREDWEPDWEPALEPVTENIDEDFSD